MGLFVIKALVDEAEFVAPELGYGNQFRMVIHVTPQDDRVSSLRVETRQLPEIEVIELFGDVSAHGEDAATAAFAEATADGPSTVLFSMAGRRT